MIARENIIKFLYENRSIIQTGMILPYFVAKIILRVNKKCVFNNVFLYFVLISDIIFSISFAFYFLISAFFEDIGFFGVVSLFCSIVAFSRCFVDIFEMKIISNRFEYTRIDVEEKIKSIRNILEGVYILSSLFLAMLVVYEKMKFGDNNVIYYCYFASVFIILPRLCRYFFDIYKLDKIDKFLKE
ncbi:hypothetical protein [Acetobacter fabarum]|uniref:hypothetical protein n=1 Tax=Acetobacter fabarum TaxID=483199 RepID=UPI0039E8CDEC